MVQFFSPNSLLLLYSSHMNSITLYFANILFQISSPLMVLSLSFVVHTNACLCINLNLVFFICKKIWTWSFWVWCESLTTVISSSIHFPVNWHNFIFLYGWVKPHCVHIFLIHSHIVRHLGWFLNLAVGDSGALNKTHKVWFRFLQLHIQKRLV